MKPQGEYVCPQHEIVPFHILYNTTPPYILNKNVSLYPSLSITRAKEDFYDGKRQDVSSMFHSLSFVSFGGTFRN